MLSGGGLDSGRGRAPALEEAPQIISGPSRHRWPARGASVRQLPARTW
jgi:hypothetical protein